MSYALDPVCGMTVDTATALAHEHAGETYYFCSAGCRTKFTADPTGHEHSAAAASPRERPMSARGTLWTCPMHPEIRRDEPGSCPICGMALEPLAPTADEGENARARGHDAALLDQRRADACRSCGRCSARFCRR